MSKNLAHSASIQSAIVQNQVLLDREHRSLLGQFPTPFPVADFMAGLFAEQLKDVNLLDAGAGSGALTAAYVRRLCLGSRKPRSIRVTAYEVDRGLTSQLDDTLRECGALCKRANIAYSYELVNKDFIASVVPLVRDDLFSSPLRRFNVAIANPPYRKIRSDSSERLFLRSVGIEVGNLYAGFVALIVKLLTDGSELVAITPRSFCNGPYFKPFRTEFLRAMSLRRLHVFESRTEAFRNDDVLQETVIVHAVKESAKPNLVLISSSSGKAGDPVSDQALNYEDVVQPDDPEQFIHLRVCEDQSNAHSVIGGLPATLADLGLTVSTGRVVDFRAASALRMEPDTDTAPLIYPCHFDSGFVSWPKSGSRKPNAIAITDETRDLLVPAGPYVLIKRFTSKEERRRVVACVYDPAQIDAPLVGFENHLNYFHAQGRRISMELARGLCAFLNSTPVDRYFRQFSGHTQVNATDLRSLRYPSAAALKRLGKAVSGQTPDQGELDEIVERHIL